MKDIQEVKNNIEVIKQLVKNTELRYIDVAETLQINVATISRWVNEKHLPHRVYHSKIAEIADFYKKINSSKKL